MTDTGYSYVGRKSCGCLVAAVVDDTDDAKDVAADVAGFIRQGLTIERVLHDVVRTELTFSCPHEAQQLNLFK